MGKTTGISWCDHTFNPWIGCQKVSAGCQHCYAARDNARYQWVKEWGKDYRLTSDENWKKPIQWAKLAVKDGVIRRVFCASLADVFDENVPEYWRGNLWELIKKTESIGGLEWLILTKRPENITENFMFRYVPFLKNIRIGTTVENQDVLEVRLKNLIWNWYGKNFVSVEPMLSEVSFKQNWTDYLEGWYTEAQPGSDGEPEPVQAPMPKIDWLIAGCESGTNARPCNIEWMQILRDQTSAFDIPFFLKQLVVDGKLTKEPYLDGRKWLEFPKEG